MSESRGVREEARQEMTLDEKRMIDEVAGVCKYAVKVRPFTRISVHAGDVSCIFAKSAPSPGSEHAACQSRTDVLIRSSSP